MQEDFPFLGKEQHHNMQWPAQILLASQVCDPFRVGPLFDVELAQVPFHKKPTPLLDFLNSKTFARF